MTSGGNDQSLTFSQRRAVQTHCVQNSSSIGNSRGRPGPVRFSSLCPSPSRGQLKTHRNDPLGARHSLGGRPRQDHRVPGEPKLRELPAPRQPGGLGRGDWTVSPAPLHRVAGLSLTGGAKTHRTRHRPAALPPGAPRCGARGVRPRPHPRASGPARGPIPAPGSRAAPQVPALTRAPLSPPLSPPAPALPSTPLAPPLSPPASPALLPPAPRPPPLVPASSPADTDCAAPRAPESPQGRPDKRGGGRVVGAAPSAPRPARPRTAKPTALTSGSSVRAPPPPPPPRSAPRLALPHGSAAPRTRAEDPAGAAGRLSAQARNRPPQGRSRRANTFRARADWLPASGAVRGGVRSLGAGLRSRDSSASRSPLGVEVRRPAGLDSSRAAGSSVRSSCPRSRAPPRAPRWEAPRRPPSCRSAGGASPTARLQRDPAALAPRPRPGRAPRRRRGPERP